MPPYSTDSAQIRPYLTDESSAFTGRADRLYRPESARELHEILREASARAIGVSISGGGTSITGARVPTAGGWIVSTERLREPSEPNDDRTWERLAADDAALYLDRERAVARVPAGLRLSELDALLEPVGLFYPPTLTEISAMIGGTIATNASGARSYRYGATRPWARALTVVLADGTLLDLRRGRCTERDGRLTLGDEGPVVSIPPLPMPVDVKNAAGYYIAPGMDAVDLFIGGEGSLGVVTEAEIALAERAAGALTIVAFFAERDATLDFADAVRDDLFAPWETLAIEYFNGNALEFLRAAYPEVPHAAGAALVEIAPSSATNGGWDSALVDAWLERCTEYHPIGIWTTLPTEAERMRLFRHALPERVNEFVRTRRGKLGTDFAVPASAFRAMMRAYDEAARCDARTVLFGHLGEYHLHLNFLAEDEAQMTSARSAYSALALRAVELGGTVSAEHGVGKKQLSLPDGRVVPYLEAMYDSDGIASMCALKTELDPAWILNRGTLLPWSGP